MTRPARAIEFSGGSEWGAYSQLEMGLFARNAAVTPLAVRVLFAALGRHDRDGHARFRVGELADILGRIDVTTGEIRRARKDTVSDAIAAAKHLGYIAEESGARCLVLHRRTFQKAHGRIEDCDIHAA